MPTTPCLKTTKWQVPRCVMLRVCAISGSIFFQVWAQYRETLREFLFFATLQCVGFRGGVAVMCLYRVAPANMPGCRPFLINVRSRQWLAASQRMLWQKPIPTSKRQPLTKATPSHAGSRCMTGFRKRESVWDDAIECSFIYLLPIYHYHFLIPSVFLLNGLK